MSTQGHTAGPTRFRSQLPPPPPPKHTDTRPAHSPSLQSVTLPTAIRTSSALAKSSMLPIAFIIRYN